MHHHIDTSNYTIRILKDFDEENPFDKDLKLQNYSQLFVLVDENTKKYCWPILKEALGDGRKTVMIEVASGEDHKNLEGCQLIWDKLFEHNADRNAVLLNLGGGVLGDMGGFAATTYKRGIDFYQIPTTLLAMVDASAGGKLGINYHGVKNTIGLFFNPKGVIIQTGFLKTLDERTLKSGIAEIIKHSVISESEAWGKISALEVVDKIDWQDTIYHSVKIKGDIVEADFMEAGFRKVLNFGHTIAHALEAASIGRKNAITHGEAVAAGIIMACYISYEILSLAEKELNQIRDLVQAYFKKIDLGNYDRDELFRLMLQDKKNRNGEICFVLLNRIGDPVIDKAVSRPVIEAAMRYYENL